MDPWIIAFFVSLLYNLISHRRSLRFHDGSVDALVFKPREKLLVAGRHWHGIIFSQWEQRIVLLQPITGRENGSWFIFLCEGSDDKFIKMWRIEQWEEDVRLCEVTEIDTIREHCDYINGIVIRKLLQQIVSFVDIYNTMHKNWRNDLLLRAAYWHYVFGKVL